LKNDTNYFQYVIVKILSITHKSRNIVNKKWEDEGRWAGEDLEKGNQSVAKKI